MSKKDAKHLGDVISQILEESKDKLLATWFQELKSGEANAEGNLRQRELKNESERFLKLLDTTLNRTDLSTLDDNDPTWDEVREYLARLAVNEAGRGASLTETVAFVHGLKVPLLEALEEKSSSVSELSRLFIEITRFFDRLELHVTRNFQVGLDEIIRRQQEELMEVSIPVIKLWGDILVLPLVGVLDSERAEAVMEKLLFQIVETQSRTAIMDITGIPVVDTQVAQYLVKTVTAVRLLGSDIIISGIRPRIAQAMVHLGLDLSHIKTEASLVDAFRAALNWSGQKIVESEK